MKAVDLIYTWRVRADEARAKGNADEARLLNRCATELEEAMHLDASAFRHTRIR